MAFPLPTALLERLRLVREGAQVLIKYTGLQASKAGRSFKEFEVFVAGEGMWTEAAEHPEAPMTRVPSEEG
jgi:hypothetical protein